MSPTCCPVAELASVGQQARRSVGAPPAKGVWGTAERPGVGFGEGAHQEDSKRGIELTAQQATALLAMKPRKVAGAGP